MNCYSLHCVWQSRAAPLTPDDESEQIAALRVAYDFMLGFEDDEEMQPGIAAKVELIRTALVSAGVNPDKV